MRNKIILTGFMVFSLLWAVQPATAQEGVASLNLQMGIPQGPFQDQLDELGFGLGGMVGYLLPKAPVVLGVDFGVMTFGSDTRTEPLSPTIPDLRVEVENSYNMFHGHLLMRITGRDRNFRPYVDALVGFNYLYTQTVVRSRGTQEDVFRDTNFDDLTFSYGLGAGVQVLVFREKRNRIYFNAQSKYIIGGEAEYLRPGSITVEDGDVEFDVSNSRTDLLYIQLGIGVTF